MRIVMTGATSGIGRFAARDLLAAGATLIVGARRPDAAPREIARRAQLLPLELGDLASVRAFAEAAAVGGPIDRLVLNAGLQVVQDTRSAQAFELTFAANHLAHQLVIELLSPHLAPQARVILTSSGTHDPAENTRMPAPRHADALRLARPDTDLERDIDSGTAGRRAYSTSKLCNVMTARTLARRLASDRPDVAVAAFDPGLTPGTGLARAYPPPFGLVFRYVLPLVMPRDRRSTPEVAGRLLASMVLDPAYASARGGYFRVRGRDLVEKPPSVLAQDDAAGDRLWADSDTLLAGG
jgi:NAD(P)-dependent dehydrogenase (short-subunit alcohol dehydrogenase family)